MSARVPAPFALLLSGFGLLLLAAGLGAWLSTRTNADNAALRHTLEVNNQLAYVLSLMQDGETGQRGYLLTGDERYLAPYEHATRTLWAEVDALATATRDSPGQRTRIGALRSEIETKLAELAANIL